MTLARLIEKYSKVTTADNLQEMLGWLRDRKPFCHLRVNDGEALCLLQKRKPTERNNCGHLYMEDLAAELRGMIQEMHALVRVQPELRLRIGSYWMTQGSNLDEAAKGLVEYLGKAMEYFPWCGSDDFVKGLLGDEPYHIFDLIRQRAVTDAQPTYLIGNPGIANGRFMLGAKFLPIPRIDCWNATESIMADCEGPASQGATFAWCCGMSKPWIWNLWRRHPRTTHIDLGHLFDGVFGDLSRAWLRRQNPQEPLWVAYRDRFSPYCRSFIPV